MNSPLTEAATDVASELIDLDAVPLTMLRRLDDAALRRALRRVVRQAGHLRVNEVDKENVLIG
jgi:FXSXX-COOH protein